MLSHCNKLYPLAPDDLRSDIAVMGVGTWVMGVLRRAATVLSLRARPCNLSVSVSLMNVQFSLCKAVLKETTARGEVRTLRGWGHVPCPLPNMAGTSSDQ